MIDGLTFASALAGFALLMLSMRRHQHDWFGLRLAGRANTALRITGFLLLGLAFILAGAGHGWAYGALCWFGWLTVAAAMVAFADTLRHRLTQERRP